MSKYVRDENGARIRIRTEADKVAGRKWDKAHHMNYVILAYKARRDYAVRVQAAAAAAGTTVSAIIRAACDTFLAEHETPEIPEK